MVVYLEREPCLYHINGNSESKSPIKGTWNPSSHAPPVYLPLPKAATHF